MTWDTKVASIRAEGISLSVLHSVFKLKFHLLLYSYCIKSIMISFSDNQLEILSNCMSKLTHLISFTLTEFGIDKKRSSPPFITVKFIKPVLMESADG